MTYIIKSSRLGTIGEPFTPRPGVNVAALLEHGFIEEVSTPKPKPAPKVKKTTKE